LLRAVVMSNLLGCNRTVRSSGSRTIPCNDGDIAETEPSTVYSRALIRTLWCNGCIVGQHVATCTGEALPVVLVRLQPESYLVRYADRANLVGALLNP